MGTIGILILFIGTFIVPALAILGDNEQFSSRNKARTPDHAADHAGASAT
jgi:hypothetical protein